MYERDMFVAYDKPPAAMADDQIFGRGFLFFYAVVTSPLWKTDRFT